MIPSSCVTTAREASPTNRRGGAFSRWRPLTDVVETEAAYQFRLDVPGVPENDVQVVYDRGLLTISGKREPLSGVAALAERPAGELKRSFRLGAPVDEERIEARLDRGVLTVLAPKADRRRNIVIQ